MGINEGEAEVYDERGEGFATRLLEAMEYIQAPEVMPVMPEREEERIYQQALRQVLFTTVSLDRVVIVGQPPRGCWHIARMCYACGWWPHSSCGSPM